MDAATQRTLHEHLAMAKALRMSMDQSIRSNSPETIWPHSSYGTYMRKYNQLVESLMSQVPIVAPIDTFNLDKVPAMGDTVVMQQKAYFEAVHANLSVLEAFLESRLDLSAELIDNLQTFLEANLRKAVLHDPQKETDIQDVVEQLLIGRGFVKGIDYDRESGRVKVSVKELVPDFNFQKLSLALEVKLSKTPARRQELVDEINADILGYGKKYSSTLFVVYDLGTIRDVAEFSRDLEVHAGVEVIVVKH